MARKSNGGPGGLLGIMVLAALGAIVSAPLALWVIAGVVLLGYHAYRYSKNAKPTQPPRPVKPSALNFPVSGHQVTQPAKAEQPHVPGRALLFDTPAPAPAAGHLPGKTLRFTDTDELVSVATPAATREREFKVPPPPPGQKSARWVAPGELVEVAGMLLPGGMLYVGGQLADTSGRPDPCLINPSLQIAKNGDFGERDMGYWPSYSDISPVARRAYLRWLADGRKAPQANIGYVFLFFYGLERRAIIDAPKDDVARDDLPAIAREIRRLLSIYGDKSNSFQRYANELLNWVSLADYPDKLYEQDVPQFPRTYELPLYVRLALGQAAMAAAPVPAKLAHSWVTLDPSISLRTPATRCGEQFEKLFCQRYSETFDGGMVLQKNRTRLKLVYRPASRSFHGIGEIKLTFGDTPDVSALTGPQKKLQALVEVVTKELEPYSRHLGKATSSKDSLEGLLLLPASLWPLSAQTMLNALKTRVGSGLVVMRLEELQETLGAQTALTKDKLQTLVRALESHDLGMEPDVLGGARPPKADERIVLFSNPQGATGPRTTPAYQAAVLTLQLASAVASADGEFSIKEMAHLREQAQSWTHLTPNHIRRLLAHLRLLMDAPVTLASLKKKLEPLDSNARETIAEFLATVAQSDGTVTPDEVKMLEKAYKALGVEPKKVFSNVHAAAAGGKPSEPGKSGATGFKLDAARIAALQADTAKVSALLANIFVEDEAPSPPPAPVAVQEPDEPSEGATTLLGLDDAHSSLARLLLSRPQWSRIDLEDVAADLDLMLDGALERINEAAFDTHDIPFTEGDDPVEVSTEILEKLEA